MLLRSNSIHNISTNQIFILIFENVGEIQSFNLVHLIWQIYWFHTFVSLYNNNNGFLPLQQYCMIMKILACSSVCLTLPFMCRKIDLCNLSFTEGVNKIPNCHYLGISQFKTLGQSCILIFILTRNQFRKYFNYTRSCTTGWS